MKEDGKMKRIIAILLALTVVFAFAPLAAEADTSITGIKMDGPILKWDPLEGATKYEVVINPSVGNIIADQTDHPDCNIAELVDTMVQRDGAEENVGWHFITVNALKGSDVLADWRGIYLYYSPVADRTEGMKVTIPESSYPFTGKAITPEPEVSAGVQPLVSGVDFISSYSNNRDRGTATVTVTGTAKKFIGELTAEFDIVPVEVDGLFSLSKTSFTFNGKVQKPKVVTAEGYSLVKGTDYYVYYSNLNSKNAGQYKVVIDGAWNLQGTKTMTYRIKRAKDPMTARGKTVTIKYKDVRKKNKVIERKSAIAVTKSKGTVTYNKVKGTSKITVAKKTGKLTVKKGLKKGTYKVRVQVKDPQTKNYKAKTKTVTVTVKVK